ncbi:NlpC/P60 family protein [Lutispora thermophila]|uniref:NlpC/P60 family protein n=1 Tax=Lutispora thermophila DSM 19022 TaxID=1122184 RepID=A0A1M6DA12_9FIRM|nr:NlpC/P60 family protein [Lutispora thermophila]SHI70092.1 NlpC/P60 family protein [Lutispora thermophila DSM 19022]
MKTNKGLVEYAQKALKEKWGYVWGTFGLTLNETLLKQKLKQYPKEVGQYESFIRKNWLGKKTVDCIGLIKAYIWDTGNGIKYDSKTDVNVGGMVNAAKEKGQINNLPEIPGILVYKSGHIGVYIGGGWVIEAKGTKYGVVKTPLKGTGATPWTGWCKCPYIVYEEHKQEILVIVDRLRQKGYITATQYWTNVLEGKEPVNLEYLKILLKRVVGL